jgi:hypothetical protein
MKIKQLIIVISLAAIVQNIMSFRYMRMVLDVYFFILLRYHVHEVGNPLFSLKGILGSIIAFIVLYEARQVYRNLLVATVVDAFSCFVLFVRQA